MERAGLTCRKIMGKREPSRAQCTHFQLLSFCPSLRGPGTSHCQPSPAQQQFLQNLPQTISGPRAN